MAWVVYILKCADDTLYTGITNDLDKRLEQHLDGTGAKYMRGRAPFELVYKEECGDRSAATKRELEIKSLSAIQKRSLF